MPAHYDGEAGTGAGVLWHVLPVARLPNDRSAPETDPPSSLTNTPQNAHCAKCSPTFVERGLHTTVRSPRSESVTSSLRVAAS